MYDFFQLLFRSSWLTQLPAKNTKERSLQGIAPCQPFSFFYLLLAFQPCRITLAADYITGFSFPTNFMLFR
jgi:hypothetical protein